MKKEVVKQLWAMLLSPLTELFATVQAAKTEREKMKIANKVLSFLEECKKDGANKLEFTLGDLKLSVEMGKETNALEAPEPPENLAEIIQFPTNA